MGFRRSRFILTSPFEGDQSRVHLYHTLYDHHLVIDQSPSETLASFLEKIETGASLSEAEREAAQTFQQMGILVDKDSDELSAFEGWYDNVLRSQNDSMVAHVTTTMACNMRCRYCMEHAQLDQSKYMDYATAVATASWLKRQVARRKVQRLSLIFFGGEPLMNVTAIEAIGQDIQDFCREEGIAYKFGVITNGTLLTPEITSILVKAGVTWAKVTLDGDRAHHDRMRIFVRGGGTFDVIWENLGTAADKLKLFIGGNFPESDLAAFDALLTKLAGATWKHAIADVRFKPIMNPKAGARSAPGAGCDHSAFSHEQVERMLSLRRRIKDAGLPTINDPNVGPCDFYRDNVMTIGVAGEVYPCSGFVEIPEFVIGSIRNDEPTEFGRCLKKLKSWCEECKDCSFLPVCAGGCRLSAYLAGRDVSSPVCDRGFYERMVPFMLDARHEGGGADQAQSSIFA